LSTSFTEGNNPLSEAVGGQAVHVLLLKRDTCDYIPKLRLATGVGWIKDSWYLKYMEPLYF